MGHKLHCVVWALAGSLWASVAAASAPRELAQDDLAWLNRVTYGISSTTVARFRADGRRQFLREQLNAAATLPPAVSQQIQGLEISRTDGATLLREVANE